MSFSSIIKKKQIFLLPFSWLYLAGVFIYHKLFDYQICKTEKPAIPAICVGNLSVGGTGKSPMVEYLIRLLKERFSIAVVSRGYKRNTKGYMVADETVTAAAIGDEPMQFHKKFKDITIAVAEKRMDAIHNIATQFPDVDVVILDDAFQHRQVSAGLNILLTACDNIFPDDLYLPAGTLRDLKANYKRADIIVVTKCREELSEKERQQIISGINPLKHQVVFFTSLDYGQPYHIFNKSQMNLATFKEVLLVTGIADPGPLISYLKKYPIKLHIDSFGDHHRFSIKDIEGIRKRFQSIVTENKAIITTEKDAIKLMNYEVLNQLPVYAIPVEHHFLFNEKIIFEEAVLQYINGSL